MSDADLIDQDEIMMIDFFGIKPEFEFEWFAEAGVTEFFISKAWFKEKWKLEVIDCLGESLVIETADSVLKTHDFELTSTKTNKMNTKELLFKIEEQSLFVSGFFGNCRLLVTK